MKFITFPNYSCFSVLIMSKIVDGKLQLNETPQVVNKEEVSQKKIRKRKLAKKKKLRYLLQISLFYLSVVTI